MARDEAPARKSPQARAARCLFMTSNITLDENHRKSQSSRLDGAKAQTYGLRRTSAEAEMARLKCMVKVRDV